MRELNVNEIEQVNGGLGRFCREALSWVGGMIADEAIERAPSMAELGAAEQERINRGGSSKI